MASLPQKGVKGDNFKKWAIDSINKLIDYLSSPYLQNGNGIAIRRTPSGTIIELEKPSTSVSQSSGGGSGTQDISNTTGNNPSIGITGSTSAVKFVGMGNVTITGNTNGQIEINATGGGGGVIGFPNYASPLVLQGSVQSSYWYPGYAYTAQPVWLIGNLSVEPDSSGQLALSVWVYISNGSTTETVYLTDFITQPASYIDKMEFPVSLLIPAGYTFEIIVNQSTSPDTTAGLAIYPCI